MEFLVIFLLTACLAATLSALYTGITLWIGLGLLVVGTVLFVRLQRAECFEDGLAYFLMAGSAWVGGLIFLMATLIKYLIIGAL